MPNKYAYERAEHRTKHCWSKDEAGFVPGDRGAIGKCPSSLDDARATELLQGGFEWRRDPGDTHPSHIFNVHRGVVFEAAPTTAGRSYHGYPWRGTMPAVIKRLLTERANAEGFSKEFKRWITTYEGA